MPKAVSAYKAKQPAQSGRHHRTGHRVRKWCIGCRRDTIIMQLEDHDMLTEDDPYNRRPGQCVNCGRSVLSQKEERTVVAFVRNVGDMFLVPESDQALVALRFYQADPGEQRSQQGEEYYGERCKYLSKAAITSWRDKGYTVAVHGEEHCGDRYNERRGGPPSDEAIASRRKKGYVVEEPSEPLQETFLLDKKPDMALVVEDPAPEAESYPEPQRPNADDFLDDGGAYEEASVEVRPDGEAIEPV